MMRSMADPLRWLDRRVAVAALRLRAERPGLLAFVFHGLFRDRAEAEDGPCDPYQPLLVGQFEAFVASLGRAGYRFVTPSEIWAGLDPDGRHALITFDDGYANNRLALPVLRAHRAPATFFVSSNHVVTGRAYWWDALYRERRRQGVRPGAIVAEQERLKRRTYREIEAHLRAEFGPRAQEPVGEVDRPMTPDELRAFAADPLVTIGNHTADHTILTAHGERDVRDQIRRCQEQLVAMIGRPAEAIAYPNGLYDAAIVRAARAEGLTVGLTVRTAKARPPLAGDALMTIPRFFLAAGPSIVEQGAACRSDVHPLAAMRRAAGSLLGAVRGGGRETLEAGARSSGRVTTEAPRP